MRSVERCALLEYQNDLPMCAAHDHRNGPGKQTRQPNSSRKRNSSSK
jgi:hypothetical protein